MRNVELAEVIRRAMESRIADLYTAMPGEVVSYDSATTRATVRPLITSPVYAQDGEIDRYEPLPDIPDVPILFPFGPGADPECGIVWPVSAGDPLLLLFSMRDPSLWRTRGQRAEPAEVRTHGLSGCFALPCSVGPDGVGAPGAASGAMVITSADLRLGQHASTKPVVVHADPAPGDPNWFADVATIITAINGALGGALAILPAYARVSTAVTEPQLATRVKAK